MNGVGPVVPSFCFDLSTLVRRSVASLYSHLVTRPTGQALRLGIESQICELGTPCVSVLDFSQVAVLDYSCADETVAKLLKRYQQPDPAPADHRTPPALTSKGMSMSPPGLPSASPSST